MGTGNRLQRLWWLHDALWYQGVAKRFGFEAANEINREAIKPIARRAMRAVLADQEISRKNLDIGDLEALFQKASHLMWPPPMTEWEAEVIDGETVEVTIIKCHAIGGIKRIGAAEFYKCPCIAVREGWLQALGLEARQEIVANMKDGAEACSIRVRLET